MDQILDEIKVEETFPNDLFISGVIHPPGKENDYDGFLMKNSEIEDYSIWYLSEDADVMGFDKQNYENAILHTRFENDAPKSHDVETLRTQVRTTPSKMMHPNPITHFLAQTRRKPR